VEDSIMSTNGLRLNLRMAAFAVLSVCCAVSTVTAQTAGQGETTNNTVNVYLWGASLGGDLSFPRGDQSFDVSLEQILDNLKMAGMVTYKRDIGDWSLLLDVIYLDLGADKNGTVTLPTEDGGSVDIDVDADLNVKTWVGGLYGGYTFARNGVASHQFIAGVRYLSLDADVTIDASDPQGAPLDGRSFSTSGDLWDGVIGFQGQFDLGGRWRMPYHLDIGTGSSQITYQALAGAAFEFGWGNVSLTYRYLYYDEGNDGVIHELTMDGPVMAVGFRF
jgi:hypothetical protein